MKKVNLRKSPKKKGKTEVIVVVENRKDLLAPVNALCSFPWLSSTDSLSDIQSK